MIMIKRSIFLLLVAFLFTSCVTSGVKVTPAAKSQTVAEGVLYRDVMRLITTFESALGGECLTPTVTKVVAVRPPDLGGRKPEVMEHWYVDRCGKQVVYAIMYHPDAQGGTHLAISKIKG